MRCIVVSIDFHRCEPNQQQQLATTSSTAVSKIMISFRRVIPRLATTTKLISKDPRSLFDQR
jgi:hypothetical protein